MYRARKVNTSDSKLVSRKLGSVAYLGNVELEQEVADVVGDPDGLQARLELRTA